MTNVVGIMMECPSSASSLEIWVELILQAAVELLRRNAEQQTEAEFRW